MPAIRMRSYFTLAAGSLAATTVLLAVSPTPRTVRITAGDDLRYDVTEINARPGERLRLILRTTGKLPRTEMAHDIVVLASGVDARAFLDAQRADSVTASDGRVLAATRRASAGETVETAVTLPGGEGRYEYVCSFPGHYLAGMKGVLVAK